MSKPNRLSKLELINWRHVLEQCDEIVSDPSTYAEDPTQTNNYIVELLMKSMYGPDIWKYLAINK